MEGTLLAGLLGAASRIYHKSWDVTFNARNSLSAGLGRPRYALWARSGGLWHFRVVPAAQTSVDLIPAEIDRVVVSAVDRLGNESRRIAVLVP